MKIRYKQQFTMFVIVISIVIILHSLTTISLSYSLKKKSDSIQDFEDKVIFDITRQGWGMIFPTTKQIYFRLYRSGKIEYEVPPNLDTENEQVDFRLIKRTAQINPNDCSEILDLVEQPDFLKAACKYPPLREPLDAVMETTILYTNQGKEKKIIISNYRPKDDRAELYYPLSLRKLLQKVVTLRPKTLEETEYGVDEIY